MAYHDLRDFLKQLELIGELKRIEAEIDPYLEVTEICHRTLRANGPALYFANPKGHKMPILGNLFGSKKRIALAMGMPDESGLREIGKILAFLRSPEAPQGLSGLLDQLPTYRKIVHMSPKVCNNAPCQEVILTGDKVDLANLPIQTCWPDDAGRLITWGLVVTKGPSQRRQNLAIYRQQVIDRNKVIMRWLAHRGGALDFFEWQQAHPGKRFPLAVVIGADPATLLAAVAPIPNSLSEFAFAGLFRGAKTEIVRCLTHELYVPATSEMILEGYIEPGEEALEGPFGDHTGYYNMQAKFPVFTIERITHRTNPIYHSTYMGRPLDEPAMLGAALNEVVIPLMQKQFPEIVDFYLPPEACSYRFAVVTIKKRYPGHAKRIMMGVWSFLSQFNYTKFILVTDDDIDARNWQDVIWAMTTRMDPARDTVILENTPIDYLDFASPAVNLGGKIGFDATNKWPAETSRHWGKPITMSAAVKERIDDIWASLGI